MKNILLKTINLYQIVLSPIMGPACRFTPTCSEYTKIAVNRFGVMRGLWMGLRRIIRCNPLGGCGHDPVPEENEDG